jgi:zinc/manganese transport system substrate-binding protein
MRPLFFVLIFFAIHCLNISTAQAKLVVFACEPEWQALAQHLGGDKITTSSAITAFQDPHFIEARPSLIAKARRADMIICTGSDLEIGWLPLLLRKAGNRKIMPGQPGHFMATDHVSQIDIPEALDRSHGDVHAGGNPHVHLSPQRIAKIAEALTKTLMTLDPDEAAFYKDRNQGFQNRWKSAMARWTLQASALRGTRVIVYHKDWSYLIEWLGMEAVADLEPKPGIAPSSAHLASLLSVVQNKQPSFIMRAAHRAERPAQWLSTRTGMPVVTLPYTVGGHKEATNLFSLFDKTIAQLIEHLPQGKSQDE